MAELLLEDVAKIAKLPLNGWQLRFEESLVDTENIPSYPDTIEELANGYEYGNFTKVLLTFRLVWMNNETMIE